MVLASYIWTPLVFVLWNFSPPLRLRVLPLFFSSPKQAIHVLLNSSLFQSITAEHSNLGMF